MGMPSQSGPQEQPSSRPSLVTLAIASASSVVAAVLVSKIWGPGTIIGAAATPVIVTFVGELLKKPAEKITVVRVSPSGTQVHERTPPPPPGEEFSERSVHRSRRRPLVIALATGLAAFAIGALVLTTSELVFGDASVASGGKRTTVFGGDTEERSTTRRKEREKPATEPRTTTTTTTVSTPAPAETPPPGTTPAPPAGASGPTGPAPEPSTGATTP